MSLVLSLIVKRMAVFTNGKNCFSACSKCIKHTIPVSLLVEVTCWSLTHLFHSAYVCATAAAMPGENLSDLLEPHCQDKPHTQLWTQQCGNVAKESLWCSAG